MEETKEQKTKSTLSIPAAIVVAAFIIGLALIVTKMPHKTPAPTGTDAASLIESVLATKGSVKNIAPVSPTEHMRGNTENPKVTIVEYSDLECPFCQRFHGTMLSVMEKYGSDVRWVYRHYPLDCQDSNDARCTPLHPNARAEAIASECAAEQGGNDSFWKFVDATFASNPSSTRADTVAKKIGLDMTAFDACTAAKTHADLVSTQSQGAMAAGATGTPYSVIIDQKGQMYSISGAYPLDVMNGVLEKLLK